MQGKQAQNIQSILKRIHLDRVLLSRAPKFRDPEIDGFPRDLDLTEQSIFV